MVKRQGIVLEVHDKWAIVLNDKGQYKKIKTARPIQVGELWSESSTPVWKLATAAVIILALLAACIDFFSVVAYAQVSSGVKIGVNRWDRVVTVEASNAQTAAYVKTVHLKGRKIDEVVEQVVNDTISGGLNRFRLDKPVLTVTTTKKDESNRQRLVQKLNKKVQPIVVKKSNQFKGSDYKSKDKNNLPAGQSRGDNYSNIKSATGDSKVKTVDTPDQLNRSSDNQGKDRINELEVWPLQSISKTQTDNIKAGQDKNSDFLPSGKIDKESLPAAGNKPNNNGEHSQTLSPGQAEKQETSPKVNNKPGTVSGQGKQDSDN